jgi:hypothetical protein
MTGIVKSITFHILTDKTREPGLRREPLDVNLPRRRSLPVIELAV